MSALTLVMKEVDMDAEEFVNVRAYHSRAKSTPKKAWADAALASPTGSDDSSGISSLTNSNGDDDAATAPTPASTPEAEATPTSNKEAPNKSGTRKEQKNKGVGKKDKGKDKQTSPENEKNLRIMYEGRNILNLERNLQPHQWQLSSPLVKSYSSVAVGGTNQMSSIRFIEKSGAFEELMVSCDQCDFREPM